MWIASRLFDLKLPVVYRLHCLDVVIQDKILLLIAWQFKRSYTLTIPLLKKRYTRRESAIIITVPSDTEVITISVSSFWRKTKFTWALKKLKLDKGTSEYIIEQLKPLKMPFLAIPDIVTRNHVAATNLPAPALTKQSPTLKSQHIQVKIEYLNYPLNFFL